ncbi:MAG: hypothetical protein J6A73_04725 [Lachnospiraceae bacterium]|nr:hypothetical protein [Lachnospiraceae bacterium]
MYDEYRPGKIYIRFSKLAKIINPGSLVIILDKDNIWWKGIMADAPVAYRRRKVCYIGPSINYAQHLVICLI